MSLRATSPDALATRILSVNRVVEVQLPTTVEINNQPFQELRLELHREASPRHRADEESGEHAHAKPLPRCLPNIHPDIETTNGAVALKDLRSNTIKENADRPTFRLIQIEVGHGMPPRDDWRVEPGHWEGVLDRVGEGVRCGLGRLPNLVGSSPDSPLEGNGFEISVPRRSHHRRHGPGGMLIRR